MWLEVIGTNVTDCRIIEACKADRVELCQALEHGGYTPEYNVIKECCAAVKIPVRVIVRHQDDDFYFHQDEFKQMLKDIAFIKTTKADGIVIGMINRDGTIDVEHLQQLMDAACGLNVTFHKAFDLIKDKKLGLIVLGRLGVKTVLTQGGVESIETNLVELSSLTKLHLLQIQAGGGVNAQNLAKVKTVVDSIHVGTMVRANHRWGEAIDQKALMKLREELV